MRRLAAALFIGALFSSSCSSGNSDSPVDTVPATTTIAPIVLEEVPLADHAIPEYVASDDTFSFANFGGGEAPADLTVNMARRLYGDSQVCSDVSDGKCTPYPVILQLMSQANKSMRGGLCEGLAVLSLRLAGDVETLMTYQNTNTVFDLVKEDPALLSEIAYWYVTQFAAEVQETASAFLEKSPAELAQVLMYDFAEAEKGNPHTGFTIGIYSEQGGHAVTPYRVEEMPSGYRIYIYDSNWPGEERWIDVSKEGAWMYALAATNPTEQSEAWSGGTGTMELTPMRARSGPFTCSFCPQEEGEESGTMLTVAASGSKQMSLKIETESGERLGYYDGKFVNEIEGATYRYLISGPSTADPVLVFLPPGVEEFSADVEEIEVPQKKEEAKSSKDRIQELVEEKVEEETQQKFSLLVLNEEKSIQIEAVIVEEEKVERWEQEVEEVEEVEEVQSLLAFSEEAIEIAEIEEATVAIAVDALEVEVELTSGQQIEVAFAPEPPIGEPTQQQPGQPDVPVVPVQDFLNIAIEDETGEVLAEVEVDLADYRVEEVEERAPPVTPNPGQPEEVVEEVPVAPLSIEISYDEEVGEIIQEEAEIEAWVASDAEYFQAVAEDRLEEVLGESYVEEILEIEEEWETLEVFEEDEIDFTEILLTVDEDYWEDEQWEEIDYDDEWFEEERELMDELFGEEINVEELFEEVEEFVDEVEEERTLFFAEHEEFEEDYFWEEYEEEFYEDDFAFQEYDPELEEQHILEEFGLEEWNEDLLGPSPTETADWTGEDWEAYDEEMDAIWEEQMEDPETWEEELLEEFGVEEWNPDWGPSPTESAEWTEDDWDEYDRQWAVDEEARILEEEGFDEWPEDWGPSPSETALWDESDWQAYDEEQHALWEEEEFEEEWEEEEWEEEWEEEEFFEEEWEEEEWEEENLSEEELDWIEETESWTEEDWENWDNFMGVEEEFPEEEWEEWTAEDEEALVLEELGLEEWPEDWGPSPTESWDWTEEDWVAYDEEQEALWEEETDLDWIFEIDEEDWEDEWGPHPTTTIDWTEEDWLAYEDEMGYPEEWEEWEEDDQFEGWTEDDWDDWTGEDEEAWVLEQEGLEEWPEDWGPSPTESWDWVEEDWLAYEDEMGYEEEEWEEYPEEEWENPYEDCIGTAACENAPGGFDTWAQWESANNPNYVAPEVGDPDYVPPPPPPPVYVPVYWAYSNDLVTSRINTASEATVTTVLARGTDGHWYETHTTETTVTTTTYTTNGTEQYGCVDNACAISGTTWDDETSSQSVAVTTATEVVPASCSQGGWTGLGDWCIVDSSSRNDYDYVAFSVPTAAEENEACDCTDGDGLMDIRIDAESNLTRAQFGSNNEHADPYIYLNHDTDSDDGDHSGDTSEITVGNQILANDDGGRDCGNTCTNPPSTATDPDETPNVTLANGDPVIENVSDMWDSRIERELSAGDYVVRGSVYNNANSGWYRLTIRDADVTYP